MRTTCYSHHAYVSPTRTCDRHHNGAVLNSKGTDGSAGVLPTMQAVVDRTEHQVSL